MTTPPCAGRSYIQIFRDVRASAGILSRGTFGARYLRVAGDLRDVFQAYACATFSRTMRSRSHESPKSLKNGANPSANLNLSVRILSPRYLNWTLSNHSVASTKLLPTWVLCPLGISVNNNGIDDDAPLIFPIAKIDRHLLISAFFF